jgi:hypothetical protein
MSDLRYSARENGVVYIGWKKCIRGCAENLKERDNWEDLDIGFWGKLK